MKKISTAATWENAAIISIACTASSINTENNTITFKAVSPAEEV